MKKANRIILVICRSSRELMNNLSQFASDPLTRCLTEFDELLHDLSTVKMTHWQVIPRPTASHPDMCELYIQLECDILVAGYQNRYNWLTKSELVFLHNVLELPGVPHQLSNTIQHKLVEMIAETKEETK